MRRVNSTTTPSNTLDDEWPRKLTCGGIKWCFSTHGERLVPAHNHPPIFRWYGDLDNSPLLCLVVALWQGCKVSHESNMVVIPNNILSECQLSNVYTALVWRAGQHIERNIAAGTNRQFVERLNCKSLNLNNYQSGRSVGLSYVRLKTEIKIRSCKKQSCKVSNPSWQDEWRFLRFPSKKKPSSYVPGYMPKAEWKIENR